MLTEEERTYKKHNFIHGKLHEIWEQTKEYNTAHDKILGFVKLETELEALTFSVNGVGSVSKIVGYNNKYRITDTSGEYWIDIYFYHIDSQNTDYSIMITFIVHIFDIIYPYCNSSNYDAYDFISRVMLQLEKIKTEYLLFSQNIDKLDKLNGLARKTMRVWLPKILENSGYFYYIDESDDKSTLHIKLRRKLQLDIPIYYEKFRTIIPDLLTIIRQYENVINSNNVKVLILKVEPEKQSYLPYNGQSLYNTLYYDVPKAVFDIIKDSILELQNFLNDNNYQYDIAKSFYKYTLRIGLTKAIQLDINVYHKTIQTTALKLRDVILQYKNLIENNYIEVLISTSKSKQKWEQ
jgi:hypothetical protein